MFAALRDCVPAMRLCRHQANAGELASMFEKEVDLYMDEKILQPLRLAIEEDLRLSTHLHLTLDDRNPFKVREGGRMGWWEGGREGGREGGWVGGWVGHG